MPTRARRIVAGSMIAARVASVACVAENEVAAERCCYSSTASGSAVAAPRHEFIFVERVFMRGKGKHTVRAYAPSSVMSRAAWRHAMLP